MMEILLNILILLIAPFFMIGIINKTKAFWSGRKGASIVQPLYDFIKLLKKESLYSQTTSWIFKITPILMITTAIFAGLLTPLASGVPILNIQFAFIIFAYTLALNKFFSLLSALDTGSSFEGMGASREACFSTIVEPAFFITMASISALTQNCSFLNLKYVLANAGVYGYLIILLTAFTLLIMLLIESCRVPVDDPKTHLELTMIHEVMILDNSGRDLAMIFWASAIKLFIFEALIANLLIPLNITPILAIVLFLALTIVLSIIIGTLESAIARFRMTHIFEFIFIMTLTSLLVLALTTYRIYGN